MELLHCLTVKDSIPRVKDVLLGVSCSMETNSIITSLPCHYTPCCPSTLGVRMLFNFGRYWTAHHAVDPEQSAALCGMQMEFSLSHDIGNSHMHV